MKKITYTLFFFMIFMGCFYVPVKADVLKVGVVDVQQVIKDCAAGKDTARKLKQKQDERSVDLNVRRLEIATLKKNVAALDAAADKEELEKKKEELAVKTRALRDSENRFGSQVRDLNTKQSTVIKNDVFRIIEQIGRKNGFTLIVEKSQILYSGGAVDITSQVIEEYDMEFQRIR